MNLTTIIEPPFEPVTLSQVYTHLRLTPDHSGSPGEETHPDDSMLTGFITTARTQVEKMLRRTLVQKTLRLSTGGGGSNVWHSLWWNPERCYRIGLICPPIIRVESVSYYDSDNALNAVDAADYYLTDEQVPALRFAAGFVTPSTYWRPDALRVQYVAGYQGDGSPPVTQEDYAANVPQPFKDAILLGVQLLYDNLSDSDRTAIERTREALVQPDRIQIAI